MKNNPVKLNVRFYQPGSDYSFKAEISEESINYFVGTALNRLTMYLNVAKRCNVKLFNLSKPVGLQVEANGKIYDTGTADESLCASLKVQRNNRGYTRFAQRVYDVIKFAVSPIEGMNFQDYLASVKPE